jgi:hypothetical protein
MNITVYVPNYWTVCQTHYNEGVGGLNLADVASVALRRRYVYTNKEFFDFRENGVISGICCVRSKKRTLFFQILKILCSCGFWERRIYPTHQCSASY